jgi:hypothetical protein
MIKKMIKKMIKINLKMMIKSFIIFSVSFLSFFEGKTTIINAIISTRKWSHYNGENNSNAPNPICNDCKLAIIQER